jgi:PiT family inorganic phosphate transporter
MTIFLIVLVVALIFEYINGFHDAANAIATVVSTKVLTPRQAILMAAAGNLLGAFLGTAVAKAVGTEFVDTTVIAITMYTILAGLVGGIVWNLITWWAGIPSSSSHALVGGLCGAALAQSKMEWSVLIWSKTVEKGGKLTEIGLWPKLIKPMVLSPVAGFIIGGIVMFIITAIFINARPTKLNRWFGKLQIASAGGMAVAHGMADAQKVMGILALALWTGTKEGAFNDLPSYLNFLHTPNFEIATWVKYACALTIAAGTAGGGWRIMRTMGHKMVKLQPVHGFAAETTAALILMYTSHFGIPLSTTHVISTSIMGVGAMKRVSAVKWGLVGRIMWAWVLTLPATALVGYFTLKFMQAVHIAP